MGEKTRIFLARHGETEWNSRDLVQGQTDVSLSETGEKQATKLADRLADAPLDYVYCSGLSRSRRTAELVGAPHDLEPIVEPALAEQDFGEWDGDTLSELYGMLDRTGTDWTDWAPENGESWTEFSQRVRTALERIVTSHRGECLFVCAHGGVNKVVLTHALFSDTSRRSDVEQGTACLNELTYTGTYDVHAINDDSHVQ